MKRIPLLVVVCLFLFTLSFSPSGVSSTVKAQSQDIYEYCLPVCAQWAYAYADYYVPRWTLEWPQIYEGSFNMCMYDCMTWYTYFGGFTPPSIP
jgi:hypothetical protein